MAAGSGAHRGATSPTGGSDDRRARPPRSGELGPTEEDPTSLAQNESNTGYFQILLLSRSVTNLTCRIDEEIFRVLSVLHDIFQI